MKIQKFSDKQLLTELLQRADFEAQGNNDCQFFHKELGRIHLEEFTADEIVQKLMSLGAVHQTNKIREALQITEPYMFKPTA